MTTISISTDDRLDVFDITKDVQAALDPQYSGSVTIFVQHTTAGITINESEAGLLTDFESALSSLVPDSGWQHDRIDDNADSHVRAMLVGPSETIPVENGTLKLGTWQSILFVECDGPRKRTVHLIES